MKIAWIADYYLQDTRGGAQQTNQIMIDYGTSLGHLIHKVRPDNFYLNNMSQYDLVITNNITRFGDDILKVSEVCKTVRFEHDLWAAEHRPAIYDNNALNIFLSPMHKEKVEKIVGKKIDGVTIPSPIDSSRFYLKGDKEPNTVLWAGQFEEHKGVRDIVYYIQQHPELKFYIAGWGSLLHLFRGKPNVTLLGELDQEALAIYYRKSQYFYHKPSWIEPFGRTVMEAYLCGCELLLNNNIGAFSYDWDYNDYNGVRDKLNSAPLFWEQIHKIL